jgi:hypothetical protein
LFFIKKEKTIMATKKAMRVLLVVIIAAWLLGSVPQATAETMTGEAFCHVTKIERFPINDIEGRFFNVVQREGAAVFENKEWAWVKLIHTTDAIKGAGPGEQYQTFTFLDGSTITTHTKGTIEATPAGVSTASKWTGDIIQGTGRFQGIKGTQTISAKLLPPEKGEPVGKVLVQTTLVYTLPSK